LRIGLVIGLFLLCGIACVIACAPAYAQPGPPNNLVFVFSNPTGPCGATSPTQMNVSPASPTFWACSATSNTWVQISGGGGPAGPAGPAGAAGAAGPVGSSASGTITGNGSTTTLVITHNFGTATHSGPSCWDETAAAPFPEVTGVLNTFGTNSDTVTFPIPPYSGQVVVCQETSGGGTSGGGGLTIGTTTITGGTSNEILLSGSTLGQGTCTIVSGALTCPSDIISGSGSGVAGLNGVGQGTLPSIPANSFGIVAGTSITTSEFWQPPNAVTVAHSIPVFAAPSGNVSTFAYSVIPDCHGATNALIYTQSSDTFGCNTISAGTTYTFSNPLLNTSGTVSLQISSNLQLAGANLDTIQPIQTTSTPQFGGLGIGVAAPSGFAKIALSALGTTPTDALEAINTTAAAVNAQQVSPCAPHWEGSGWKTATTAGPQVVDWCAYVLPVQGSTNPSSNLIFQAGVNGGAYSTTSGFAATSGGSIYSAGTGNINSNLTAVAALGIAGTSQGFASQGTSAINWLSGSETYGYLGANQMGLYATGIFTFSSNVAGGGTGFPYQSLDSGIDRDAAGVLGVTNGTQGTTAANYRDLKLRHIAGAGPAPTIAAGGAISTTPTIGGTDLVGTVSVPSTAVTTGTIATVTFGTAFGTAPNCWVSQNGGLVSIGVGHGTPGTTTFTITAAIANVSAAAYLFDYGCGGT
jgi:hypothetical protein